MDKPLNDNNLLHTLLLYNQTFCHIFSASHVTRMSTADWSAHSYQALDIAGCLIFYSAKALPTNGCYWTRTWTVLVSQWFRHYFLLWIWRHCQACYTGWQYFQPKTKFYLVLPTQWDIRLIISNRKGQQVATTWLILFLIWVCSVDTFQSIIL